tara:strand:- start:1350 stop:1898 length:549 start_codon:yes stop_codon:yes gene_type:complete
MNRFVASLMVGVLMATGSAGAALANLPSSIVTFERVSAAGPASFQMFCAVNPDECRPGGASKVALTESMLAEIKRVNQRVNRAIRPKLDSPALQLWRVNPPSGDCKSYVISKRHALMAAGLPSSALRIAFVKTRRGENHAVLVLKTDRGDLTLDNLTGDIKLFAETGYRVVAISGTNPKRWS